MLIRTEAMMMAIGEIEIAVKIAIIEKIGVTMMVAKVETVASAVDID